MHAFAWLSIKMASNESVVFAIQLIPSFFGVKNLAVHKYEDLEKHVGHKIECVYYADEDFSEEAMAVSLECVTCSEVLVTFDNPKAQSN